MLVEMPLWGFVTLIIFAVVGVWSIGKKIYDKRSKLL